MAVFKYDPAKMKALTQSILDDIGGGDANSLKSIADDFKGEYDKLIAPGVWTGTAAAKNIGDFETVYNGFVDFANQFMNSFDASMTSINSQVSSLETNNLGSDIAALGLTKTNLGNIEAIAASIEKEVLTYNYATIVSIGAGLEQIRSNLANFESQIDGHISQIGCGGDIWEGNAAESTAAELKSIITTNMEAINADLQVCINNIKAAGENAQAADVSSN